MKTKTCQGMVQEIGKRLSFTHVTHHFPTESNRLGQSGVHTFIDDVMNIVLNSSNEGEACRKLNIFLLEGEVDW